MPRQRKRTTSREPSDGLMKRAADMVINENVSVRQAPRDFELVTLFRYIKKIEAGESPKMGYNPHTGILSVEQEEAFLKYIRMSAIIYFCLTPKEIRKLVYQLCSKSGIRVPAQCSERGIAGKDFFTNFMRRHPNLSIRTPEPTSYARAVNFNKVNVGKFFENLGNLIGKYSFQAADIYNVDETGVTTVQRPSKIVAVKGTKQVGAVTSGERGTLVTVCAAINAVGNSVPPMFIFPRKKFQPYFINNGPPGCIGDTNGSGWMNEGTFMVFLQHFVRHVRQQKEKKVLLLLDNHDSHLYVPTIEFCWEKGVVLLSFPPHISHKIQPLDRGVYGSFKHYVNIAMDNWMKTHPGQSMSIYDIPGIVGEAFPRATTPANIMAGFKLSGIWPFNRDVFQEEEFAPSSVIDRPLEELETSVQENNNVIPGPSTKPNVSFGNDILGPSNRPNVPFDNNIPDPITRPDVPFNKDEHNESFQALDNIGKSKNGKKKMYE